MSSKPGLGRLTFSGRSEYTIAPVFGKVGASETQFAAAVVGYAARCTCALGDHFLAIDEASGTVIEQTSNGGAVPNACIFRTQQAAADAIEQWQRQRLAESEE